MANIQLQSNFLIAETETFLKKIKLPEYCKIYDKIKNYIYPQLKQNPYFGKNIKKLKKEFEGVYRYRTGKLRVFYTIDERKVIIFILDIEKRKDSY